MEEACTVNNLELVKQSFASLLLSSDETIPLEYRFVRGGFDVIRRSSSLAAELGHTAILSFLLDQGPQLTQCLSAAILAANNKQFCQALVDSRWQPRIGTQDIRSVGLG